MNSIVDVFRLDAVARCPWLYARFYLPVAGARSYLEQKKPENSCHQSCRCLIRRHVISLTNVSEIDLAVHTLYQDNRCIVRGLTGGILKIFLASTGHNHDGRYAFANATKRTVVYKVLNISKKRSFFTSVSTNMKGPVKAQAYGFGIYGCLWSTCHSKYNAETRN